MKIVCLGDSLTYGFGVRRGEDWVSLTAAATGHRLINRGINGDTTGGMLARFRGDVLDEGPGAAVIMGGTNDILTAGTDSGARSNMAAMIQQAASAGVTPIIGIPIPADPPYVREDWGGLADFSAVNRDLRAYGEWLRKFCGVFGASVVDFTALFAAGGEARHDLYLDGLHPNIAGHTAMANLLKKRLTEVNLI